MKNQTKWYAVYLPYKADCYCFLLSEWPQCERLVRGSKNVAYKKFLRKEQAEIFLKDHFLANDHQQKSGFHQSIPQDLKEWEKFLVNPQEINVLDKKENQKIVKIYTDGSFLKENTNLSSWGFVAIFQDKKIKECCGISQENSESRNIVGEITAVVEALKWFVRYKNEEKDDDLAVCIFHDYIGVAHWSDHTWKAKTEISGWYQREILELRRKIGKNKLFFQKVAAHSGNKYNEYIDKKTRQHLQKTIDQLKSVERVKKRSNHLFS